MPTPAHCSYPVETHTESIWPGWGSTLEAAMMAQLTGPRGASTLDLSFISTVLEPPEPARPLKYKSAAFSRFLIPRAEVPTNRAAAKECRGTGNRFGGATHWLLFLWMVEKGIAMLSVQNAPTYGPSGPPPAHPGPPVSPCVLTSIRATPRLILVNSRTSKQDDAPPTPTPPCI